MTQLILPGFETTPRLPAHHLFLTIKLDVGTAERIARLIQQLRPVMGLKDKALRTKRLHVTPHYLDDFVCLPPEDVMARVRAATDSLAMPAFDVTFSQMVSLHDQRDHRPFTLLSDKGVGGLTAFQAALGEALKHAVMPVQHGSFKPHTTLLYDRGGLATRATEPITWTVREFAFIHSWLGKTRYDEPDRWAPKG